jgi:tripartite-type tricarboxylate transporter receptor subunit TctC
MKKRTFLTIGAVALAPWGMLHAQARYPDRPIRLVVPFAPGGDGDIMGRTWVKHIAAQTGMNIVVENKAGAGGVIGAAEVARARPDGYTLLLGTSTTQIINPAASASSPYDPIKDFELIGMVSVNPTCIVVNPKLPVNTLKELIALIKANPGKYAYGSAGPGTITNLTGELFKFQAGKLDMQHVPYKGGGPAMQDLIAGHVPIITPILSSAVLAQHRAGRARILCVNNETRLKAAPEIPTAVESGLADMRVQVFNAVFVPASTPKEVVATLKAASQKVISDPEFLQDVEKAGGELLVLKDPDNYFKQEVVRWSLLIKTIGFKI